MLGTSRGRMARFTTPASTQIRRGITAEATTAAVDAADAGTPLRELCAIAIVTAVLDTSPPTAPVTTRPRCAPSIRTATKPTKDSADTSTTTSQISRGLSTPHGPYGRFGSTGR